MTNHRRSWHSLLPLLVVWGIGVSPAWSDYFEVRRPAVLREAPETNAPVVGNVAPGTLLILIEAASGKSRYYHVRSPAGNLDGWIFHQMGRVFEGEPPRFGPEDEERFRRRHLAIGRPTPYLELVREGYALGYDTRLKIPLWVQYELAPEDFVLAPGEKKVQRTDDFREDPTLPPGASGRLQDFSEDGNDSGDNADFARGHLVPAADRRREERLQSETFLLTNMVPQVGLSFNSSVWLSLEDDIRDWVEKHGAVTVIVGPAFLPEEEDEEEYMYYRVLGKSRVAVPTHLFKIVVDSTSAPPRALAFLLANEEHPPGTKYSDSLVSVDHIESICGLDLLSALPDDVERQVEAERPLSTWWAAEDSAKRVRRDGRDGREKKPRYTYPMLVPTVGTTSNLPTSALTGVVIPTIEIPMDVPWVEPEIPVAPATTPAP